ncbi:MAG: hypothetical protein V8Q40_07920 [Anaerosacchariphilus sp.]
MKKALRTLTALAFVVLRHACDRHGYSAHRSAFVSGAALVESMLEKKAGKTAESLAIHRKRKKRSFLRAMITGRRNGRCSGPGSGQHGTCWAFASLTALETALMPEKHMDFSPGPSELSQSF